MHAAHPLFEPIVQELLEHDRAIVEGLFPLSVLDALHDELTGLQDQNRLRPAAIGAADRAEVHTEIRSDFIRWWPDAPTHPAERAYLKQVNALSDYLNRTCFTGILRFECMYAAYPEGARYARHVDDFQHKNARKFSVITYLNKEWDLEAGGELVTYGKLGPEWIAPTFGKTVIFPSPELEHEVLTARRERWSVTGWMR